MCPAMVSGIVTGETLISYWSVFPLSPVTEAVPEVQTLTIKDCKGPQTNMPKNVGSIKTWSAKMKSRHIKFCKQNTAILIVLRENIYIIKNTIRITISTIRIAVFCPQNLIYPRSLCKHYLDLVSLSSRKWWIAISCFFKVVHMLRTRLRQEASPPKCLHSWWGRHLNLMDFYSLMWKNRYN